MLRWCQLHRLKDPPRLVMESQQDMLSTWEVPHAAWLAVTLLSAGPQEQQIQVITLDTRSFRDDLTLTTDVEPGCGWVKGQDDGPQCSLRCYSSDGHFRALEGPCKNDYVPNELAVSDGGPSMLGAAQWVWLEEQLRVVGPKLRIIASSVQFAIEYNGWEGWLVVLCKCKFARHLSRGR